MRIFIFVCSVFLILSSNSFSAKLALPIDFDFATRDQLPQTKTPSQKWKSCCGSFGPKAASFPKVKIPKDANALQWQQERVIAVAKHYLNLPYAHKHIPAMGGLDCSNFTAWVYNYGFGIALNSNVHDQANTAGTKLAATETLNPGDLLYIWNTQKTEIVHVVIYIGNNQLIDDTKGKVAVRDFAGWYKTRFAWARRVI
jgi:cell wall-associated NlpC family hydrolase